MSHAEYDEEWDFDDKVNEMLRKLKEVLNFYSNIITINKTENKFIHENLIKLYLNTDTENL